MVLTPKILGPPKIGALGLSLYSLMVNPRLPQIWTWGRQTFFLPRAPSNLVTLLGEDDIKGGHLAPGAALWVRKIEVGMLRTN